MGKRRVAEPRYGACAARRCAFWLMVSVERAARNLNLCALHITIFMSYASIRSLATDHHELCCNSSRLVQVRVQRTRQRPGCGTLHLDPLPGDAGSGRGHRPAGATGTSRRRSSRTLHKMGSPSSIFVTLGAHNAEQAGDRRLVADGAIGATASRLLPCGTTAKLSVPCKSRQARFTASGVGFLSIRLRIVADYSTLSTRRLSRRRVGWGGGKTPKNKT